MSSLAESVLPGRARAAAGAAPAEAAGPRPWSLRRRVLLLTAAVTAMAWIVGGTAMYMVSRHVSDSLFDQRLRDIASTVLTFADHEVSEVRAGGAEIVHFEGALTIGARYHYQIWSTDGELLLVSVDTVGIPFVPLDQRGFVLDRVRLLNLGADDYLVKPFDLLELSARLRALGRRQVGKDDVVLEFGPLLLSRSEHVAVWNGARVELTKREYRILDTLLRNRDRVLSRKQLEEALYGWGEEVESNAIEVHVHNLRRKLSRELIETVRGAGYRLNNNVQPA